MHPTQRLLMTVMRMFHDTRAIAVVDLILLHHGKITLYKAVEELPFTWSELQNTIRLLVAGGYLRLDPDTPDIAEIRDHGIVYASYESAIRSIATRLEFVGGKVEEILRQETNSFACLGCHEGCSVLRAWLKDGTIMTCPACDTELSLVSQSELDQQEQRKMALCISRRVLADLLRAAQSSPLSEPHVPGAETYEEMY